jgi:hypothetical protein
MKSNNFYKNKMAEEINNRIESTEWNSKIAAAVLSRKRNTARKIFFTASVSSLAAAAAFALIFSGVLNNKNDGLIYDEFITAQIKGTYDASLPVKKNIASKKVQINNKKTVTNENTSQSNEDIITEDIDSIISETLALR